MLKIGIMPLDEFRKRIEECDYRMKQNLKTRVQYNKERVFWLQKALEGKIPLVKIREHRNQVDRLRAALKLGMDGRLLACKTKLREMGVKLDAFNPKSVLDRGYSISRILPGKKILMDADDAAPDEQIEIVLSKGRLVTRVEKKNGQKNI